MKTALATASLMSMVLGCGELSPDESTAEGELSAPIGVDGQTQQTDLTADQLADLCAQSPSLPECEHIGSWEISAPDPGSLYGSPSSYYNTVSIQSAYAGGLINGQQFAAYLAQVGAGGQVRWGCEMYDVKAKWKGFGVGRGNQQITINGQNPWERNITPAGAHPTTLRYDGVSITVRSRMRGRQSTYDRWRFTGDAHQFRVELEPHTASVPAPGGGAQTVYGCKVKFDGTQGTEPVAYHSGIGSVWSRASLAGAALEPATQTVPYANLGGFIAQYGRTWGYTNNPFADGVGTISFGIPYTTISYEPAASDWEDRYTDQTRVEGNYRTWTEPVAPVMQAPAKLDARI